jgi:UDP-N-acetylglucosamine--N-acetylmuramyl-(pentapeptide) pyrophosphoryl-undecaprenol N-acetylglucosamine transferase
VVKYVDRMELALAVATLVVARAGSSTVAELMALGIPAVFVPYPVGNGEQRFNARSSVEAGGAVLVADRDFTPEWVDHALVPLLRDRARVAEMAARMTTVGVRDGADRMVDLISRAASRR